MFDTAVRLHPSRVRRLKSPATCLLLGSLLLAISGCTSQTPSVQTPDQLASAPPAGSADELLVVDCLLPGKVKKLGRRFTYLEPRRAIKTSARDCEIRGGEYVAFDRSDYRTALKVWLSQAKEGDKVAQTYVGEIYEKGFGLQPDYAVAAAWYRKAAERDYAPAQINLGHLYEKGLGVERDPAQALNWYRKASGLTEAIVLDTGSVKYSGLETDTQQELQELRQEVERWKRESASLRQQLQQTRQQLDQTLQELQQRQSAIDTERQQLEQARQELERLKQRAEPIPRDDAEVQRLEAQLQQREADLTRQQQDLLRLQQAEQQKLEQARQDLERQQQQAVATVQQADEVKRLEAQLQQREAELNRQQQDLLQLQQTEQQKLEQARQDLERRQQQVDATAQRTDEVKRLEAQLQQREAELNRQQQEVDRLQQEKARLEEEAARRQAELAERQKQQQVALAGPTIEILDPLLVGTRGFSVVKVRAETMGQERIIVGRVVSPAGLDTLTVNGRQETIDEQGMFRVPILIPVRGARVPVKVEATDEQGKHTSVEFQFTADAAAPVAQKKKAAPAVEFGTYYALLIGNNAYTHWPDLATPENDAKEMANVLSKKYGFKTKVILDATRFDILQALNDLRKTLTEKDNLLIYYAGHGHYEEQIKRGYWVPVDGDLDSNVNWIATFAITDILGAMSAKHVLVVADSCYSGALTRSAFARLEAGMSEEARLHALKAMAEKRSRTVLSAGNLQPVLDIGGGNHSVFAKAFLDVLTANTNIIEGQRLWFGIRDVVAYAAKAEQIEQDPQYAPLRFAGHEAGDFLFVPTTLQ